MDLNFKELKTWTYIPDNSDIKKIGKLNLIKYQINITVEQPALIFLF